MPTAVDVVNYALEFTGSQVQITSLAPVNPPQTQADIAANAAAIIYLPTWQMVARQNNPDFARRVGISLAVESGGILGPWAFEYAWPSDALFIRQVAPSVYDVNDPQPVRWQTGVDIIASQPTRVIWTNQAVAVAAYTSSNVTENQWDAQFLQAVVRQLANPLAMAIAGRPDFARELLMEAQQYEQLAVGGDESVARVS